MTEEHYAQLWAAEVAARTPEPKAPAVPKSTSDRVLDALRQHPSGLTANDIAHKSGLTRYSVKRVMQRLRDKVRITTVKQIMIYEAAE
jgi:response regulator of citrate/malate metabolism